jgi:ABC-type transport system involved in multi-copper enzyme maturation permease subunit
MTAGTTTPYRSDLPVGRDGFAQVLRAEWTKFRTVRGWVIGAAVAVLLTVGLGLFAAGAGTSSCSSGNGPARSNLGCAPTLTVGPGGEPVMDNFYFVRQPLAGNGSITVRVTSLTGLLPVLNSNTPVGPQQQMPMHPGLMPWAKAGLIIKNGTAEGSAYAAMMVTGSNGVRMQADYTQDTAGLPGAVSSASPRWLRLTRSGDTITGYDSADGTHWTQVGSVRLTGLPTVAEVGLFTASPGDQVFTENFGGGVNGKGAPSQATAVFDHLNYQGEWRQGSWTGGYIGGGDDAPGIGGYHQSDGRYTVTGSGDIAPVVSGPTGPGDSTTISVLLVGTFAGLIAMIVVATLFITAEYRRGLIRVTLAASPRRGRVLAAKAVVIGVAGFAAGLVAAAVTVILGSRIARGRQYVFPVSWATELRVVVGTATLIAVVAVLALGVGAMMRRSAAAVTTVIVVIVLPYILAVASVLPVGVADWLLRLTPAAAFAVQQAEPAYPQVTTLYSPGGGFYPLAPWAGFAVLCGFAAFALAGAAVLLRRRDA